ncbi:hypothetical protein JKF63_01105 [Porcisia hertigi]|uniref:Uncharacterized protein n=1 Tax=Porcisia hertigi TaxID=2761500 RepID=A0A836HU30_9TRYP|nr:hypothetical protein JKF63_01105 [Porcisia hertigi]
MQLTHLFVSFQGKRGRLRATAPLRVALLVLFIVFTAAIGSSASEAVPSVEEKQDHHYAYLDMLDEVDLQQMLHEKTQGRVQVSAFRSKEELVAEVRKIEELEDADALFNERVASAMKRKAAFSKNPDGAAAASGNSGSEELTRPLRRHLRAGENNIINDIKKQNTKEKTVQLTGGKGKSTMVRGRRDHSKQGGRASASAAAEASDKYAGTMKVSSGQRSVAAHELKVLYCTG